MPSYNILAHLLEQELDNETTLEKLNEELNWSMKYAFPLLVFALLTTNFFILILLYDKKFV